MMDILDIDEALKDDSFIFLEDKTHDDVSNILQQWRNNNNCTSSHNSEQAFKLNTRTFTRPKRKTAQNLEAQFSPIPQSQQNAIGVQPNSQQNSMNVNLEIGGLVTTMQKSFLQDTSPPSSICSSMDVSMNGMNGSLITSADFTNINFLQSTRGDEPLSRLFFNPEKATEDGYTLNDMIRDRKALESLTLSGEGTLIKDSNIAQIDDISLINSKTTSTCSTMNNSTDSMGGGSANGCSETFLNRTCNITEKYDDKKEIQNVSENMITKKSTMNETFTSGKEQIVPNGDDDFIGNTSFSLVDSSIGQDVDFIKPSVMNVTTVTGVHNETFKKPLEETVCLKRFNVAEVNTTFDCNDPKAAQCETPENLTKHGKYYEQSTPQQNTSPYIRQKQAYTPSIKTADVNISPIIGPGSNRTFNETFEKSEGQIAANILKERIRNETFGEPEVLPRLSNNRNADYEAEVNLAFETMELLANINPNETFNKSLLVGTPSVDAADEEAFDNMLDELGKLELNAEQIKMRKSLDTIKKRFTCGAIDKSETKENSLISSSEMASSGISMNSSGGGDRLLNRRSRLYDDININKSLKSSPSGSINSISYVKETDVGGGGGGGGGGELLGEIEKLHKKTDEQQHCIEPTESAPQEEKTIRNSKLEKRDRDRFKTIRIFKRQEDGTNDLNVPCIDGDLQHESEHLPSTEEEETPLAEDPQTERLSRRDITPPIVINKIEVPAECNNYATFKKPKDKVRRFGGFASGVSNDQLNRPVIPAMEKPTEQRSLSRPRYLSGLQKFSVATKAISAGDLEKAEQITTKVEGENFNKTQPTVTTELKSPMGIKSKSFHNLSSNFGYGVPKAAPLAGVRKSTTAGNVLTEKQGKINNTTIRTNTRINAVPATINLKQPSSKLEKSDDSVLKTQGLVSGLRAPSAKRIGLIRPSSGYYSFSVAKGEAINTADLDAGRHSPTDSMSSASSRGSSSGKPITNGIGSTQKLAEPLLMKPPQTQLQQSAAKSTAGIPKPSGLRPPSSIKRSGLPRPASIVRR